MRYGGGWRSLRCFVGGFVLEATEMLSVEIANVC